MLMSNRGAVLARRSVSRERSSLSRCLRPSQVPDRLAHPVLRSREHHRSAHTRKRIRCLSKQWCQLSTRSSTYIVACRPPSKRTHAPLLQMLSCDRFLNPLDSFAASHVIVLNVGRPIRCVEWLPRAADVIGSQYVALALEQWSYDNGNAMHGNYPGNPDRRSPPGSTLLLILNCGRLRQSLHVPNLHVTVAADYGQVTCLKWLPERPSVNDPYLSYLAVGTSQGIVIIFGVPHGASRNLCTISGGAQLVPPLNRRKDGSIGCAEYGSCTALDWCYDNPNKLCAGYENGIVLMWELNSKSLVEQVGMRARRPFVKDTSCCSRPATAR